MNHIVASCVSTIQSILRNNPTLFALPQASASNNLATRNLTVRQGCEADSYLRMTDCITQSMRQPHFWQTKPNCPTAPDCGQLSRIVSLQYTKGWPAPSAAAYTCIALLHIFEHIFVANLYCHTIGQITPMLTGHRTNTKHET